MAAIGALLLMLRAPRQVAEQAIENLKPFDLQAELGHRYFSHQLWHQSASCLYPAWLRDTLLDAFAAITACSFTFHIDRLRSRLGDSGKVHWELVSSLGTPTGFEDLITARCSAFSARGIHDGFRNSAHLTTSYFAPRTIKAKRFEPVIWQPAEIELVEVQGHGRNYRYRPIASRPLGPPLDVPPIQTSMPF